MTTIPTESPRTTEYDDSVLVDILACSCHDESHKVLARCLLAARQRIAELTRINQELVGAMADVRNERSVALAAVREMGRCEHCEGSGKVSSRVGGREKTIGGCRYCSGTGWHPAAQPFVKGS